MHVAVGALLRLLNTQQELRAGKRSTLLSMQPKGQQLQIATLIQHLKGIKLLDLAHIFHMLFLHAWYWSIHLPSLYAITCCI